MSNMLHTFSYFLLLLNIGIVTAAKAQCSRELFPKKWYSKLEDFHKIKTYRIDGKGGDRQEIVYSHVLSRGTTYRFITYSNEGGSHGIIISLYDSKGNFIATNYQDGEFKEILDVPIKATGIYFAKYTFKDSRSYCGMGLTGFKRDY